MSDAEKIESEIMAAQRNGTFADRFIEQYMPFIRSETAKFLKMFPSDGQDELSIAMFAFYECVQAYHPGRGAFLHLASVAIRNRLIDYTRKEQRHRLTVSMDAPASKHDDRSLMQTLEARDNRIEKLLVQTDSEQEIKQFADQLSNFGIKLSDVADECPRQKRTMSACLAVLNFARKNPELLDEMVKTKRLPAAKLTEGSGVKRKTIEHHRRYLIAILLAYTNGYEIIRGHLCQIKGKEEQK